MSFITVSNGKGADYKTNDKIMTPEHIAKWIVKQLPIGMMEMVLDPFRGTGAFYNNFPEYADKDWCEIDDGRDFFEYNKHADWIISNPPYSKYTEVMRKSFEIADNVVHLVPLSKVVSSMGRIKEAHEYGGLVKLWIISASMCGFPFGFPACIAWFKRDYNRSTIQISIVNKIEQQPKQ